LENAKCLTVEEDVELIPVNLGIIASYYYIKCSTLEHFSKNLTAAAKLK
jgi:pre-mRNA-splicing helicase BRR2